MTKTILVVDDSGVSRLLSRQFILHSHPDWIIEEAVTGEDAVEKLANITPDLILLDVNMPGMGGVAAVAKIREISSTIPICLLTANVQEATRDKAHSMGVQFAEKPVTQARIDHILSSLENA